MPMADGVKRKTMVIKMTIINITPTKTKADLCCADTNENAKLKFQNSEI